MDLIGAFSLASAGREADKHNTSREEHLSSSTLFVFKAHGVRREVFTLSWSGCIHKFYSSNLNHFFCIDTSGDGNGS